MVAAKQKTAGGFWAKNKAFVFIACGFVLVILLGFLYYQSQRPNFRDLEKEFSNLQIPANWQQESESSNKGTLGLFCWQLVGEECPYLIKGYSKENTDFKSLSSLTESILGNNTFRASEQNLSQCTAEVYANNEYNCEFIDSRSSVEIIVRYSSTDSQNKSGDFATVNVARK